MAYFDYASLETNWAVTAFVLTSGIYVGRAAFWRQFDKVWRIAMEQYFNVNFARALMRSMQCNIVECIPKHEN
jgi:hypothetical protein